MCVQGTGCGTVPRKPEAGKRSVVLVRPTLGGDGPPIVERKDRRKDLNEQ